MSEIIFNDIRATAEDILKVKLSNPISIDLGLMNLKWIVKADNEKLFVKQINKSRYNEAKRSKIRRAMYIQKQLKKSEVACPDLFSDGDNFILRSNCEEFFVITEFIEGKVIDYGDINVSQIRDLGKCIGKMHFELNNGKFNLEPSTWKLPTRKEMELENLNLINDAKEPGDTYLMNLLNKQKKIIKTVNLDSFKSCKIGWAHSDLWSHNVLFSEQSVAAILDFDRLQVNYPELDNARSILSFALKDDSINEELIEAFIDGYSYYYDYTRDDLEKSIKLLWFLESFWWMRKQFLYTKEPPTRMLYEMEWITNNWESLLS